jgi:phage gp16-like protein
MREYIKDRIKELLETADFVQDSADGKEATLKPDARARLMNADKEIRRQQLAVIHIGKKALALDDESYRTIVRTIGGAESGSAADLDDQGRRAVLKELNRLGFVDGKVKRSHKGRPLNMDSPDRGAQLGKIEAMLLSAGKPWAYADAIARRVCGVDKVTWCNPEQLRKIIAALVYNAKRHGQRMK